MSHLTDYPIDGDVYVDIDTYDSDGASVTITGLAITDIEIYKDGSTTQRASDNGYSLQDTDGIDFDGKVGCHGYKIDLSDNSDAGFYAAGSFYKAIVDAITVDGQTVRFTRTFTIGWALRPTTAGRTLDVAATGEAGVDLGNVTGTLGNANVGWIDGSDRVDVGSWLGTAAATPTTPGVPEVELTNKTGLSLAATGLDAIGQAATGMIEIAKAVWDRVLTAGTHNIPTSAGRRLRGIQEFQGYEDGAIWIDTIDGTAGTTDYENGTVENPVDTIADANTIAASLGIKRFMIAPGSMITLAAAQSGQSFKGQYGWTLALGGQDVSSSTFEGATVSGISAGTGTTQKFINCLMGATSHIKGTHLITCGITGTQTIAEAGDHFWDRCHSGVAGTSTPVLDWGAAVGSSNVNIRAYSGGIQFENMGDTGTDTASLEGWGQLIEGTCTGGTVAIRGNVTVSGITNLTLSDDARIDVAQVNAEVVTALAAIKLDHLVAVADADDPVDDSIMAKIASTTGDWSLFVPATDALQSIADTGGGGPTVGQIADAVWDELLSGHVISGSSGEALAAAGTAGDPWLTPLPGAYGAGTAGQIIGDNINAPLGTIDTVVDGLATTIGIAGAGLTDVTLGANAHGGAGATLTIDQLRVNSTDASGGIYVTNSGGHAVNFVSTQTASTGLVATGGVGGHGALLTAGAIAGNALHLDANGGSGIDAQTDVAASGLVGDITGNLSGSVGSLTGHTNQTADHTTAIAAIPTTAMRGTDSAATAAVLGTPVGADISADIAAGTASIYTAEIDLAVDEANTQDEYTVAWKKDGVRVTSGITVPTIQVVKRADGTDLIASAAMTQIGSTGAHKYDEAADRITAGEAVLVLVGATIDGSARTEVLVTSRDSSA